jgi:hypothetical protein
MDCFAALAMTALAALRELSLDANFLGLILRSIAKRCISKDGAALVLRDGAPRLLRMRAETDGRESRGALLRLLAEGRAIGMRRVYAEDLHLLGEELQSLTLPVFNRSLFGLSFEIARTRVDLPPIEIENV